MTVPRFVPLAASALCLSACAGAPSGPSVGSYPAGGIGADGRARPAALASLPASAGRVVAVRRLPYANGFGQEIVLDGPRAMSGENLVTVRALTTATTGLRGQGAEELKLGRPTDTEIAAEMDRALPGVAMRLAPAPERGEAGAIGYATGTMGRLSCVYAWQYLEPARPLSLLEGAAGTGALPVSVRVRLCREQPAAALVEALRGLRVSRPDGPTEVAEVAEVRAPPSRDALAAAVGSPPPAAGWDRTDADPASAETARPTHSRDHRSPSVRHRAAARSPKVRLRASTRPEREPSALSTGVARVPMPGDVSTNAERQRVLPAPASSGRTTAVDLGTPMDPGMPMPR